jgi:benzoyl-CoA reductase subunit C
MKAELSEFRERLEKRHERGWKLKKKGQKLIACFYGLVPKELIHAAGMVPIQLVEDRDSRYEEQAGLPPYFCGLSKNLAGQIFSRVFDYVDGLMVATVCDTNRRIFDVWEHRKLFPHSLLVRLPVKFSERAVKFYGQECRRLARELEKISGVAVTEERLRESIGQFNENRELFRKLYDVLPQSGISGEDALHVFGAALVTPVEDHNGLLRKLLASLNVPSGPDSRTKLMLCAINLNMAVEVVKLAEKYGARMVTNDFTHNARYGSEPIRLDGDPFESLARGYLGRVPAPGVYPFEARANYIRERMEKAGAQGMIYLIQLYCDAYAFEYAILKERFDSWNLRHLKLEAEDTPSSIEQLNVRVQSFVESLL